MKHLARRWKSSAPLGASLVVLSSLFYATYGVWTKLVGNYFGAFTQGVLRSGLTTLFLLIAALLLKQLGRIHWRRDAKWFALSFFSSIFIPATMYYSVLNAGIGVSIGIAYIGIVLGMFFFGWLLAKERFTKDKWLSTLLGIAGLGLVFLPGIESAAWLAMIAALGGGVAVALNIVVSKKLPYSALQTAVIAWALGSLANFPFIFLFGESVPMPAWDAEWLYLCVFAATSVVASWAVIQGVKLIEAGAAGVLGLLEIIFGVMLGVVFFGERPGAVTLFGLTAILAAAAIPYIKDYNAKRGTLEETA